jgi:DNA-directed RNA polymerase specialized sigma24 family protein
MDQPAADDRLSHISTMWTMVFQAHGGEMDAAALAQNILMQRYSGAVFRYLLGALRDSDAASELAQEFALRFVRGDFHRADPQRGRFRDYVKTSLSRLVADHFRTRKRRPQALGHDAPEPAASVSAADFDREFVASWRAELLERTWRALAAANASYHAILLHRIDHPDAASADLAEQLSERFGKPVNAAWVRKTLQRAHEKFTDLLLDETACSINSSDKERLREELAELDLLKYCRSGLERRGS